MAKKKGEEFLRRLREDSKLRETYAASLGQNAMMEAARSGGFEFTLEDLRAVLADDATELSDAELQQVAGGKRGPQKVEPATNPEK